MSHEASYQLDESTGSLANVWFVSCLVAAALRCLVHSRARLPRSLQTAPALASWLLGVVGLPCLLAWWTSTRLESETAGHCWLLSSLPPLLAYLVRPADWARPAGTVTSAGCALGLAASGAVGGDLVAVGVAALLVLAATTDRWVAGRASSAALLCPGWGEPGAVWPT